MKKRISASELNQEVQELRACCVESENLLREVSKQCHSLSRKLEHIGWEEDVEVQESIVFTGTTKEFVSLLLPLIQSHHCKVDGKNNREALLRVIDNVIKVQLENGKGYLKFPSLLDAVKRCLPDE